ncbi:MAG: hypothetical protein RBU27_00640 [Bacteroidota bacterium]|jgi:hypothetical protein|nr:hypothetical protein [Bacteroidota bacterium]
MSCRGIIASVVAGLVTVLSAVATGQDISSYTLQNDSDVFHRELSAAVARGAMPSALPKLDCAVEYIRRQNGEDVVYRRGPIDLHQESLTASSASASRRGTQPASAETTEQVFRGGLLVDLPRAGETDQDLALAPRGYRYMLRVALVPMRYERATLHAQVFLERAVVTEDNGKLVVHGSEVFSRTVELVGNLPLKFDLPEWEASLPDGARAVPTSLHEAVLITLETPRHFGLPESFPEPFAERTLLTYAVPRASHVRLSIQVHGEERVIDAGPREAGTYEVVWNAADLPDREYDATFTASDAQGTVLYTEGRTLRKSRTAENWTGARGTIMRSERGAFVAGIESGVAYQLPADDARALRNMFTHVVLRLGYRFSARWEVGVTVGQDAFHERPGPDVDIERISEYGGVVGYTYGYAAAYLRWTLPSSVLQPYIEVGAGASSAAALAQLGFGIKAEILRNLVFHLGPSAMVHMRSEPSTKLGLQYGMSVRF